MNRPQAEVDALMDLIVVAIERETPDLIKIMCACV